MEIMQILAALVGITALVGSAGFLAVLSLIVAAVTAVYSITEAQKAKKDAKRGNVLITKHDNNAGLKVIYGQRRVGAIKVWKDVNKIAVVPAPGRTVFGLNKDAPNATTNATKRNIYLDRIDVIGEGPIAELVDIEVDGDHYTHKRFNKAGLSVFRGIFMDGSPGQGALTELASAYSEWNTTSVGNKVAYVNSRFRQHKDYMLYRGEPDIQYEVKGKLVWDPRKDVNYGGTGTHDVTDETTWEWSDNPALCLLDYLMGSYGRGLSVDAIDVPSFVTAANSCDILVDVPDRLTNDTGSTKSVYDPRIGELIDVGTGVYWPNYRPEQDTVTNQQKRLTCNAVLDPSEPVLENVKKLLQSMRGTLPYSQGKYSLRLEDVTATSMTFDTSDIIGGIKFAYGDKAKRYNRVTVVFPNANKKFKEDRVSWPALDSTDYNAFLAEDQGFELWETVELDAVTDYYQAEDIAEFIVRQSREQLGCEITVKSKAIQLQPNDVIEVTHPTPGWTGKKFRVRSLQIKENLTVKLSLQEYNAYIYTWRDTTNEPYQPDVGIASPYDDLPDIVIDSVTVSRVESASGVPQGLVTVTWEEVDGFRAEEYLLKYKPQSDTVYRTTRAREGDLDISFVADKNDTVYDVALAYRTATGAVSNYTATTVTVPLYQTDLDIQLNTIELETGDILDYEIGGQIQPADLSDLAVYYKNSELTLQTNIDNTAATAAANLASTNATLTGQITTLNDLVNDITSGTADVYLQASAPVAGVGGVPNPIPANSRWYDSDDANHPYVFDGTDWVSIRDTRVADNAAAITALEATVDDPTTGVAANAAALDVLDTTVKALDGTVTSQASSITQLQTDLDAAELTIADHTVDIAANAAASSSLDTRVTAAEGSITSNSSDIATLTARLNSGGDINTAIDANSTAIGALDTRVTATESSITAQASDITVLTADLEFRTEAVLESGDTIQTEDASPLDIELENDLSAIVAGASSATRALTTRVESNESGLYQQGLSITALDGRLSSTETGLATNVSAVDSLETRMTITEDATTVNAANIVALDGRITTTEGDVLASASAISSLQIDVTDVDDRTTANALAITGLRSDLATTDGNVTANSSAISTLQTTVDDGVDGVVATAARVDTLEATVNNATTGVAATAFALDAVELTVNDATTGVAASAVRLDALESTVDNPTTGVVATATALGTVTTTVNDGTTGVLASAVRLDTLESTVNNATTGVTATAAAVSALETATQDASTGLIASANRLDTLETTVNDATTGVAATASALDAVELIVTDADTGNSALGTRVSSIETSITDPSTGLTALSDAIDTVETTVLTLETGAVATNATAVTQLQSRTSPPTLLYNTGTTLAFVSTGTTISTGTTFSFTPVSLNPVGPGFLHVRLQNADPDDEIYVGYNGTSLGPAISAVDTSQEWFTFPITSTTGQNDIVVWKEGTTGSTYVWGVIVTYGGAGDPESLQESRDNFARASANATAVNGLNTRVTQTEDDITTTSSALTLLKSTVDDPTTGLAATATVATGASTTASANDGRLTGIEAEYFVRTDVYGHVAGFGLVNTGSSSEFSIAADKFKIVNPSGVGAIPFAVDATTGVTTMANVNITGDLVVDGTITNEKVGDLEIDTGKININAVTIPYSAQTSGALSIGTGNGTWYNVQSLTMDPTEYPLLIDFAMILHQTSGNLRFCNVRLRRGSTVLFDTSAFTNEGIRTFDQEATLVGYTYLDSYTSTSAQTYYLDVARIGNWTGSFDARYRTLKATVLKR